MNPVTYTDKIFHYLETKLSGDGTPVNLDALVVDANRDKFIEAVKRFIDEHPNGKNVDFNSDYTKIRKYDIRHDYRDRSGQVRGNSVEDEAGHAIC